MKKLINSIPIFYDDMGTGPAVVLIHGFPLDRRMWHPQAERLAAEGFRVITPDLRGFGESWAGDIPCSISTYADDVATLLKDLGIGKAVIGGMSMGGYILMDMLERHRELFSAAMFIVTRSVGDTPEAKEKRTVLARDIDRIGPRVAADSFKGILFADETLAENPALADKVYEWMANANPEGLSNALLAMRDRKDYTPLLASFDLPALIVGADRDKAVPQDVLEIIGDHLPDSRTWIIHGGGHLVNLEQPEAFNDILIGFVKGIAGE